MKPIGASVGLGGRNKPTDVAVIQQMLNQADKSSRLTIDGLVDEGTIKAITRFQKSVVGLKGPDSRIDAIGGKTLEALVGASGNSHRNPLSTTLGLIHSDRFVVLYDRQYRPLAAPYRKGLIDLLGYIAKDKEITDIRWAAYMLATTMHETGRTWLPVEETGKGGAKKYAKEIEVTDRTGRKYKNVYYGRGYVQITWERNYAELGKALGMDDELRIHPDKALQPDIAYRIMSHGMRHGLFTGKKLSDYLHGALTGYYHARRIINALDKAQLIQAYAEAIEQLLRLSQSWTESVAPVVECTPTANVCIA